MSIVQSLDLRRQKLATKVKWGLAALAALLVSPVIFMIVQGLIGLAIAGVVGLAIISFAPVVSMKFASWKLQAIKAEAAANPIETMQQVFIDREADLRQLAQRLEDFSTEVLNFEGKLAGFRTQFPKEAPKFDATHRTMLQLLEVRRGKLKEARDELRNFGNEIAKADAIWKMGQAAASLHKAAGMTDVDFMERIKTETAIESVQTSLNRAISQLETSLSEETPALENSPSDVIDIHAVEVRERMRA